MSYQFERELEQGTLLFTNEHEQKFIFEKIPFAVSPHEAVLREIIQDLRAFFKDRQLIPCEGVIQYIGFEKYQGDLYLIRPSEDEVKLDLFEIDDLNEACQVLLKSLQIMQIYHQHGIILNGWSIGVIKRTADSRIYFADPLLMNYLQKWLDELFVIDFTPEVIKGRAWTQAADIFSWGGLAYRLLTGSYPFVAGTLEERLDKIINGKIVAPHDQLPGLHPELGKLIMECFNRDPEMRPTAATLLTQLTELIKAEQCLLSPQEIQAYSEKASQNRQRQEFLEKVRGFWRKYKVATLIGLGVIVLFLLLVQPGARKIGVSEANTPEEIVNYYFKSIAELNTELMDDTLYKANNTFAEMIGNLYVMNRMQQGITRDFKDYIQVKVNDLQIQIVTAEKLKTEYQVNYTLLIITATEKNYVKREDLFALQPIKNIWKITNIKILKQKKWTKQLAPVTPVPTGTK